jgi:hypothetical protein
VGGGEYTDVNLCEGPEFKNNEKTDIVIYQDEVVVE